MRVSTSEHHAEHQKTFRSSWLTDRVYYVNKLWVYECVWVCECCVKLQKTRTVILRNVYSCGLPYFRNADQARATPSGLWWEREREKERERERESERCTSRHSAQLTADVSHSPRTGPYSACFSIFMFSLLSMCNALTHTICISGYTFRKATAHRTGALSHFLVKPTFTIMFQI